MGIEASHPWDSAPVLSEGEYLNDVKFHQDKLKNGEIDQKYPYAKQAEVIQGCLRGAFGEYAAEMKISNALLLELKYFMTNAHNLHAYTGNRQGDTWQGLKDNAILGGNAVKSAVVADNLRVDKKIEQDLLRQGKSKEEVDKVMKAYYDNFLKLLRERIQYEVR